ncbi:MAG: hypothetical protein IKF75_08150, partial [Lachnospiraceae bacterium]|nr:hypothetical protein [Lachnospiraceae bacterium]
MNNSKTSSWTLAFSVIFILGGLAQINAREIGVPVYSGIGTLAIGLAFAVLTWRLRVKVKAEQAAAEARRLAEQRRAEADRIAREKAVKAFQERYVHETFPVAGVTFQNEDKIDRQKILLEISFNEKAETSAWLEEEKPELGEDSGIMVMTDYGCVGYIRRSDKPLARRVEGKTICTSYLSVEQFM